MSKRWPLWLMPGFPALIFLLAGLALLPYPGLQHDELFFYGPISSPDSSYYDINILGTKLTCMVMSYSGALKTWLYQAILLVFPANRWTVRVPVLLTGIGTILLTWAWVRRTSGARAAAFSTVLLATDTLFLMTDLFDWGPVALQHILLMGGLAAAQIWLATGSRRMLRAACFLWGLGMWDKALMVWPLSGMAVAAVCVYPREVLTRIRPFVKTGAVWFLLGALPLIWYNVSQRGVTATANTRFEPGGLAEKLPALRMTVDGSMLSGYMVYNDPVATPRRPETVWEAASAAVHRALPGQRKNGMILGYALGLLLLVLLWRTPVRSRLLFLLITCVVMWLQMALNHGTGGSSHHVILMWPFPVVFLGIAFDGAASHYGGVLGGRVPALLAAFAAVLGVQNLLTTNDYLARFIVNGARGGWTDAVYPLAETMSNLPAAWIGVADWGYLNGLRFLPEKTLKLFEPDPNPAEPSFRTQVTAPDFVFVRHTPDKEILPGVNEKLRKAAAELGYEEKVEQTVADRNGRPVFEIFRFRKHGTGASR